MSDLTTWLLAQLDAETETARAAVDECGSDKPWVNAPSCQVFTPQRDDEDVWDGCVSTTRHRAAHIARQDPQATLDRVEALRAVVVMHRPRMFQTFNGDDQELDPPYDCTICWDVTDESARWPCPTLRALAYAYRRQPGWESRWAPDGVEVAG